MASDTDDQDTKDQGNNDDFDHLNERIPQWFDSHTCLRSKSTDQDADDHGQDDPEGQPGSFL